MTDLSYHPVLSDADELIRAAVPVRLLILGDEVPAAGPLAAETKLLEIQDANLPTGTYQFAAEDGEAVMVVWEGAASGAALQADWDAPDEHPLIAAYGWLEHLWPAATAVPKPLFAPGDEAVTVPTGQEARVRRRDFDRGSWWYDIRVGERTTTVREPQLAHPEIDDDPEAWVRRTPAPAASFAATLTRAKLREELSDTLYSFRATRTLFRPYQFRPIMRLLETGLLRILIADEVGLGKTIEAGLIWTELDARRQAGRVLIVCPSMLVAKWREEMLQRFGFELAELDRDGLEDLLARVEDDRLPSRYHAVCSVERLRVWPGLDRLAEIGPHLDLVIIDEAHVLRNAETRSHQMGALLADWTDALVLLSATPLNLGNEDLFNLLSLVAPGEFDSLDLLEKRLQPNKLLNAVGASLLNPEITNDERVRMLAAVEHMAFGPTVTARPEFAEVMSLLQVDALTPRAVPAVRRLLARLHALSAVVTRTRKVEIEEHKAVRHPVRIDVAWTEAEAAFYLAFDRWQREEAVLSGLPVGFVTQMPLRLASTCLPAARRKVLEGRITDWGEDLDADDPDRDDAPTAGAIPKELVQLARAVGDRDTKFDAFIAELLPLVAKSKRVLVFTFSRPTLAYLEERLAGHVRLGVMHGGVEPQRRQELMRQFRDHGFDVLLASRVASEGLDFEFCSAVVNYDLPWNPMEVEQRIGRIDRFGQEEDVVYVLNFHTPGTIETEIIERVHRRIGVFESSIGELEPILQSKLGDLKRTMFDFRLTELERRLRVDEQLAAIEERRQAQDEVEPATAYLASVDGAEIAGLEEDLVASGRYIGQAELALLLADWTERSGGASISRDRSGLRLRLRGTAAMAEQVQSVGAAGERSRSEVEAVARALRDEREVTVCVDQETARTTGESLLTANHPLTRAALRVPGRDQASFAHVRLVMADEAAGEYLILIALARWKGVRSAVELWTTAVSLGGGGEAPAVGAALLAALAEGGLGQAEITCGANEVDVSLKRASRLLRRRQDDEEGRRSAENEALAETRRLSLRESHARKVRQIETRIATLKSRNSTGTIHLQEAQLRSQERLLREQEAKLEAAVGVDMQVEPLAVCLVQAAVASSG